VAMLLLAAALFASHVLVRQPLPEL
jgi:hypothetical protein